MKDTINAILMEDIDGFIKGEIPYYVISKYDDEYVICDVPIIIRDSIGELTNNLAYDYDCFKEKNKEKYEEYVKTFYKSSQRYILGTKIYTIKKK